MAARLDPFVDVMLRERADQLYLLPDEPVTLIKDGKPRKVSKQPLTDQHIYALMVEVAPPEAADKIDQQAETEFDYAGANGLVRVRIVPEAGRLTAVISAIRRPSQEQDMPTVTQRSAASPDVTGKRPAAAPAAQPPKAAAPRKRHVRPSSLPHRWSTVLWRRPASCRGSSHRPSSRPPSKSSASCCARWSSRKAPICTSAWGSPHVPNPREIKRQSGTPVSVNDLELLVLSIMPERNRGEWKETGDTDFAYEISGLARFRVNAARDRKGPVAVFPRHPGRSSRSRRWGSPTRSRSSAISRRGWC